MDSGLLRDDHREDDAGTLPSLFIMSRPAGEPVADARRRAARWNVRQLSIATIVCSIVVTVLLVRAEAIETFFFWSRRSDQYGPVEVLNVFVVAACAMGVWLGGLWRLAAGEVKARGMAEARLRTAQQSMRQLFASSPVPMLIAGFKSTRVMGINGACRKLLGYSRAGAIGARERALGLWKADGFEFELRRRLAQGDRIANVEVQVRNADGGENTALCSAVRLMVNDADVLLIAFNDITERKQLERLLAHQAFHDPLTDLPNRALFEDRVRHALDVCRRTGESLAVLFIDLDDFKKVNDTHGHGSGDVILREAAARLHAVLRSSDTCARFGGDEFAVLLENTGTQADAVLVASRISEVLRAPFVVAGAEMYVDASVGISISRVESSASDLMQEADLAMYASKAAGKGCARLFESAMKRDMRRRFELEADLRGAASRGELRLLFQPIVNITTGVVECVEALCRWEHPTLGLISPAEFIPIAEESGMIFEVGEWVLRAACQAAATVRTSGHQALTVSVNLSARQLTSPRIVPDVIAALKAAAVPPSALMLEITETVLLRDIDAVTHQLQELKDVGVRLAIDDFGTGYSSLAYLQRLPVDVLKIDKSFTDRLDSVVEDKDVVRAIIALGGMVKLQTVVEGIETPEQRDVLLELGCELGQGYFFSRPVRLDELRRWLESVDPSAASAFAASAA